MASNIMAPYERRGRPGLLSRILLWALLLFVAVIYGLMAVVLPPQFMIWQLAPILLMIGLILWLLPDVGGVDYTRLQGVMIPYLALAIVWPNYVAFDVPGLPWISMTRGALLIVMLLFLWNFSTSREMRDKAIDSVSVMPLAIRAFWGFWAVMTISLVFANEVSVALNRYVNNQIYWTMGLLLTAMLATRPGFVGKVAKTIVISTIIVICYSLYEARIERVPWLDYLPPFLKVDPELFETLMSTQARAGTDMYRVRGPYLAALYFSEYLTMAYPFLLHFTVKERRLLPFFALAAATFGCMVVMYLTNARSAMVGLLVASVLYIFYSALRRRTQQPNSLIGTGLLMAYPAMLVVLSLIVWFWQRAHVMVLGGGAQQASSDTRAIQWAMAWPKLMTHPLGYGVGQGNIALGYFNLAGEGTVDSYFITVMMDAGYLALPLFLLTFLLPAFTAFKYYRNSTTPEMELLAPLSLAIINFVIVKGVLTSEASIPLAFMFVGCIFGLVWQIHRYEQPKPRTAPLIS